MTSFARDAHLQDRKLRHEKEENAKKRTFEAAEGKKNRRAQIASSVVGAAGKVAGSGLGSVAKLLAANHPEWYKKFFPDMGIVTNLPQFNRLVDDAGLGESFFLKSDGTLFGYPSLMLMHYLKTIGNQDKPASIGNDSPYLYAMNFVQTRMRELNSRTGGYEPTVLAVYLIACVEVYEALSALKRLVGATNYFDPYDTSKGGNLLMKFLNTGSAYSAETIKDAVKTILPRLNQLIQDANTNIIVPKDFDLLNRRVWLASNVFADSSIKWKQLYMFDTDYTGYYDAASSMINMQKRNHGSFTGIDGYLNYIQFCINQIKEEPDFLTIQSDMRAAYGDDAFYKMEAVTGDYVFEVHDLDEVKSQIHNLTTIPYLFGSAGAVTATSLHIRYDLNTGYLYQGVLNTDRGIKVYYSGATATAAGKAALLKAINGVNIMSFNDKIDSDEILVSTRLKPLWTIDEPDTTGAITIRCICCGTEIVTHCEVVNVIKQGLVTNLQPHNIYTTTVSIYDSYQFSTAALGSVSQFDWHPVIRHYYADVASNFTSLQSGAPLGAVGNLFHTTFQNLANIHYACVASEFITVPTRRFR